MKPPLMILPLGLSKVLARPFMGLGHKLSTLFSSVKYDLQQTDIDLEEGLYLALSLLNALFFFFLFFGFLFVLSFYTQGKPFSEALLTSALYGLLIFFLIGFVLVRYPSILAGKKAEQIDRHLIFALKDLLLQIAAGVSLYNAMVNVAQAKYGQVSIEFAKAAKAINTGMPTDKSLEKMATSTKSSYLRRVTWQLINTMRAGASLQGALRSLINDLTLTQRTKINDYARELNLWTLVYMLFAVAIPTIGATLLVILSSFAGFGLTQGSFIAFLVLTFIVQLILIGFVKSRRPIVNL